MKRCDNWPAKLDLFIDEKRNQPFDWTTNNCAFFAADWVAMLTGVDLAASFRDKVTSARSAREVLDAEGGIVAVAERCFDRWYVEEVPVNKARRGDVVATDTHHGPALGVMLGAVAAFAGPEKLQFVPLEQLTQAWRIG